MMLHRESDGWELTKQHLLSSMRFPMLLIFTMWAIHLHQEILQWDPGMYGIMSRRFWGIQGIITGPLVHGSWGHLISNTVPLFVLTMMSMYFYRKVAMRAFWIIYIFTGGAVWLFARDVSHIGASGVVYGLVAFIFWNGIFRGSVRAIMLAAIVILLYSGMFAGVLPDQEGVSWESHLLGSIVGIITSYWFKSTLEDEEMAVHERAGGETVAKQYFLPRDTFDMTKEERRAAAEAAAEAARIKAEQEAAHSRPPEDLWWTQSNTWTPPSYPHIPPSEGT